LAQGGVNVAALEMKLAPGVDQRHVVGERFRPVPRLDVHLSSQCQGPGIAGLEGEQAVQVPQRPVLAHTSRPTPKPRLRSGVGFAAAPPHRIEQGARIGRLGPRLHALPIVAEALLRQLHQPAGGIEAATAEHLGECAQLLRRPLVGREVGHLQDALGVRA
jgi:hypothetical protein